MRRLRRRLIAISVLGAATFVGVAGVSLFVALKAQLPAIYSIADYRPPSSSQVISEDGEIIGTFAYERRIPIAIDTLQDHVRFAFLAAEDAEFYRHEGINWWGVLRAFGKNLRPGAHLQGASTITQQTVKTLIVGPERSMWRKVREAVLARRLEQTLGKDAILGLYLNQIYFGHGAWGIEEAALTSFGKHAKDLSVVEAATLAAAPKQPTRYALDGDRNALWRRRKYVLLQMAAHGWLKDDEARQLAQLPLPTMAPQAVWPSLCRDYVEHVRRLLQSEVGEEALFAGGLRIQVGLNARAQRAAMAAVRESLENVAQRKRRLPKPWLHFSLETMQALLPKAQAAFTAREVPQICVGCPSSPWVWSWRHVLPAEPDASASMSTLSRTMVGRQATRFSRVYWPIIRRDKARRSVILSTGNGELELTPKDLEWVRLAKQRRVVDVGDVYQIGDVLALDVVSTQNPLRVRLVAHTEAQAALAAIDPQTRFVRALVGAAPGSTGTGFNRVTQAKRQPGSAFKPILYATALLKRIITPASLCQDAPIEIQDPHTRRVWRPDNYEDGHYDGPITFREALARSKNTCSVRLMQQVGIDAVRDTAAAMGIDTRLPNNLPLALGTGEVTPLAITNAMATLAAGGRMSAPRFVQSVTDSDGHAVYEPPMPTWQQALPPEVAFVMTSMLQTVIEEGTGRRAKRLQRPLAGKTGTSQDARDTWFVGYAPSLAASTWIGFDNNASLGRETGASAALPAWIRFMGGALASEPPQAFTEPAHVVHVRVDATTGAPVIAAASSAAESAVGEVPSAETPQDALQSPTLSPSPSLEGIDEVFVEGTQPGAERAVLPSIFLQDDEPLQIDPETAADPDVGNPATSQDAQPSF